MPNWTWWQWFLAGYISAGTMIALLAWLFGHKKAPDDAATSEPEQREMIDRSILREAEKVKRKMRGGQR